MSTSRGGTKSSLSISEKLNVINKVDGVLNVPCIKNAKEQSIPVRKVTDKMLWQSEAGENVLRLLYVTHAKHKYVLVFKK